MSGGKKFDQGKPPLSLIPTKPLLEIAKVLEHGAGKYDEHNWRKGMKWSRLLSSSLRHITAFNEGEDLDPESGINHLAHAACGLMFLLEYYTTHKELDDRYRDKDDDKHEEHIGAAKEYNARVSEAFDKIWGGLGVHGYAKKMLHNCAKCGAKHSTNFYYCESCEDKGEV